MRSCCQEMEYRLSRDDYFKYFNNQYLFIQEGVKIILDYCPWCCRSLSIKDSITPEKEISKAEYEQIHIQDLYRSEKRILALGLDAIPISNKNTTHCCNKMSYHLSNIGNYIQYHMIYREYCFSPYNDCIFLLLDYCPWCGTKLPKDLRNEFFDILEQDYGIETSLGEVFERTDLPPEFHTDEWWKKRGL